MAAPKPTPRTPFHMTQLHTAQELSRLRRRASQPAFAAAVAGLRQRTDDFLARDLPVPERSAGFYHDYFCPEHAVELTFDPASPTRHRCPSDGRLFSGEPFDSAWLWFVNNRLSTMALSLALRWRIDGEPAPLRRAGEILTGYASRYGSYRPLWPREFGNGKATFQSLDEAVWLIPLARAYDLVRDGLGESERSKVEELLLRPAAEHILGQKYHRIHNIENWHNAAIAAVGLLLGDERLFRIALEEENGFHHQLAEGVRDDGLWWEGSSSYHFYALTPMIALAQVCAGRGLELWKNERFEKMFRAPIDMLLPGLRLPANNDCWFFSSLLADVCHGVPAAAAFYEVAHAWYGDPAFAWVLTENYRHGKRDSLEALLHGRDEVAEASAPCLRSVNFEPTGCALFRSPGPLEKQDCLLLKYGPDGGGHGHPDKLGTFAYARGIDLSADLGTPGYGIELNDTWYRQTLSHNTVLFDGCSQPPAEGRLVRFKSGRTRLRGRRRGGRIRRAALGRGVAAAGHPVDAGVLPRFHPGEVRPRKAGRPPLPDAGRRLRGPRPRALPKAAAAAWGGVRARERSAGIHRPRSCGAALATGDRLHCPSPARRRGLRDHPRGGSRQSRGRQQRHRHSTAACPGNRLPVGGRALLRGAAGGVPLAGGH